MKKIEIFKRRLIFKIEKKEEEEREYHTNIEEVLSEKVVYLVLIMSLIGFSSKLHLFTPQLNIGDVVTKDIIAPRSLTFNDRKAKTKVIEDIINNSAKEYIYIPEVELNVISTIDKIYSELEQARIRVEEQVIELEKTEGIEELEEVRKNIIIKNELERIEEDVSFEELFGLYSLGEEELAKSKEQIKTKLGDFYKIGIIKGEKLRGTENSVFAKDYMVEDISDIEIKILKRVIIPNYIFDEETTASKLTNKAEQLEDVYVEVKAGTLIVGKGEILTEEKESILRAYGLYSFQTNITKIIFHIFYLISVGVIFYLLIRGNLKKEILSKNIYRASILIIAVSFLAFRFVAIEYMYLIPIDSIIFLLGILVGVKYSGILGSMSLIMLMPIIDFDLPYYFITTMTFFLGLYLVNTMKNRTSLINAGLTVGTSKMALVIFVGTIMGDEFVNIILNGGAALLSGIFSGMITIALLPYFERTFNLLTTFKLIELGDLSNPLLKKLSVNTPGTFHHSMMVATLSENAAEKIGANAIFCRVASYYHDIGKIKRPNFYVENQRQMKNPHNDLSPSMSNLIITSHTKDGVELGKEYGIPKEIRGIMTEHQGTTLLAYFYNKAKQLDPSVNESDFRYSGPKPKSKESAIIMLADSIEAAVRSLDEKTPITIEKMIRKIISGKIEDNQLSDADLTFKEIEIIIASFVVTLMGIHHIRLKYPGQK